VKITVSLFAQAREIVGQNQLDCDIPPGAEVSVLIQRLQSQFPDLLTVRFMIAVNSDYVKSDYKLQNGDKVAIIPPIGGG
jgi:molybdopterin converting factor subunit 1